MNEALMHGRLTQPLLISKELNCSNFDVFAELMNCLNGLENAEYALFSDDGDVFDEMHRLTQRQFEWQVGFSALSQLYRAAYIYSGTCTQAYFRNKMGFSIKDFMYFCFCMRAATQDFPAVQANIDLSAVGMTDAKRDLIRKHICAYPNQLKQLARKMRHGREMSYRPSVLRSFPCIMTLSLPRVLLAPLPDLILQRCTSGIFYDFADASGHIKHEAGSNFESYCQDLLVSIFSKRDVTSKNTYKYGKNQIETPDIFLHLHSRKAEIAIECKGTKMSFDAKFSKNPIASANTGYKEVAKGIFQIWRYISHKRRGLVLPDQDDVETFGLVITLDSWLTMLRRKSEVFSFAEQLAAKVDPGIIEQDKIPVTFCSIEDFEILLRHCSHESLFRALAAASTIKYDGWMLSRVHAHLFPEVKWNRTYPLEQKVNDLIPWWGWIEEQAAVAKTKINQS